MSLSVGSKASNKTKNYPSPQTFVKLKVLSQLKLSREGQMMAR